MQTISCVQIQIQATVNNSLHRQHLFDFSNRKHSHVEDCSMFFIDVMAVHSAYCFSRMLHSCLSSCTKLHANNICRLVRVSTALFTFVLMPVSCPWICPYLPFKMEASLDMENRFYNRFNEHLCLKNICFYFGDMFLFKKMFPW